MATTDRDKLNYRGMLFLVGQNRTPFLNMLGGMNGSPKLVKSFLFPLTRSYNIPDGSQDDVTSETLASAEGTPTTYDMAQAYNAIQIHKENVAVTYAKESTSGEFSGLNVDGEETPIDTMGEQKLIAFQKLAKDINYSFVNGTFVNPSTSATVGKTRGILTAITTNVVPAGGNALTTELFDSLILALSAYSDLSRPVILTSMRHKQELNNLYGFAEQSMTFGGLDLSYIVTPLGPMPVVFEPAVPDGNLAIVDMAKCRPVFVPFRSKSNGQVYTVNFEQEYKAGAVTGGFFYTQAGLDYGHETAHGKISGLATA